MHAILIVQADSPMVEYCKEEKQHANNIELDQRKGIKYTILYMILFSGREACIMYNIKLIITVGEGDGTNYHFRGDLDVAIFSEAKLRKDSLYIKIAKEVIVCHCLKPKGDHLLFIFHILRILLYDWSKVYLVMKNSSPTSETFHFFHHLKKNK